ncbi:MAG: NAD(P)H-dependent oxidoreductase [Deltaproteobacteria bacterium]|nr:NAD(P)H-dependent oxidoreductase [Deltaproteobacteria bacterium]
MAYSPGVTAAQRSINLVHCHPYPDRSRAGRILLDAVRDLPGVKVRSLYKLYPDFDIDVEAEQQALVAADIIVWQGPFYWYGVPALLSLWFEKVLSEGWAYGAGTRALQGKTALWATTTGAPDSAYQPGGVHGHTFETFIPAISQTARFCGMNWVDPPVVVHGAHRIGDGDLRQAAQTYRARLEALAAVPIAPYEGGDRPHG